MLTTSHKILDTVKTYSENGWVTFGNDPQKINLKTETAIAWLENDSFFRNLVFYRSSLNEPITFVLLPKSDEVLVKLESRIIPNLTHWLTQLGYTPDFYTESFSETEKVLGPMAENMVTEILEEIEKIVVENIEKEPIQQDLPVNTNQPKTIKKRKEQ